MRQVGHFFAELFGKMLRWLLGWAIVIGGLVTLGFSLKSHQLPTAPEWTLIVLITIIAGMLGMVSALAWELTHIGAVVHFVRSRAQRGAAAEISPSQPEEH